MLMCLQILIPFGMLRLKFTPTFSHPSFDLRLALFLRKSPLFAMLIRGGVLCSPLVVYVWCYTPPIASAYTTRSCYARLPARFGHIILSCGVQFEGNRGRGIFDRTITLRSVRNNVWGFRAMLPRTAHG